MKIYFTNYPKMLISRKKKFLFFIEIFYLKKTINFIYNSSFCCSHTCYCVGMVSVTSASRYVTSASRYHPRYQRRSSMYIRGLIPRNFAELAGAVPIASSYVAFQRHSRTSRGLFNIKMRYLMVSKKKGNIICVSME